MLKTVKKGTKMDVSSPFHFIETKDEKYPLDHSPRSVCQCRTVPCFIYSKLW